MHTSHVTSVFVGDKDIELIVKTVHSKHEAESSLPSPKLTECACVCQRSLVQKFNNIDLFYV